MYFKDLETFDVGEDTIDFAFATLFIMLMVPERRFEFFEVHAKVDFALRVEISTNDEFSNLMFVSDFGHQISDVGLKGLCAAREVFMGVSI